MLSLRRFKSPKALVRLSHALSEEEKKLRFSIQLDKNISDKLKRRRNPGQLNTGNVVLPISLRKAAREILLKYSYADVNQCSQDLTKQIWSRAPPMEGRELEDVIHNTRKKLLMTGQIPESDNEENWIAPQKNALYASLRGKVYHWKPFEFSSEKQALNSVWSKSVKEVVFVDSSSAMNDLSRNLQEKGDFNQISSLTESSTFYRQFLTSSVSLTYDLVVSSRSLFELGEMRNRITTLDILWRKVRPGGYLVLVEAGTFAGYRMILEARDYLLQTSKIQTPSSSPPVSSHILAPCPHDHFCPKFSDKKTCNFDVKYFPLDGDENSKLKRDLFSYLVIAKSERSEVSWPKVVEPVIHRSRHRIVRVCTPLGSLQEYAVTKRRHGKELYALCKHCKLGDLLPIQSKPEEINEDIIKSEKSS